MDIFVLQLAGNENDIIVCIVKVLIFPKNTKRGSGRKMGERDGEGKVLI